MYEFIRGPLMSVVSILVAAGIGFRIYRFFRFTSRIPSDKSVKNRTSLTRQPRPGFKQVVSRRIQSARIHYRNTIFGMTPVTTWTTVVYHAVIFTAVFFVQGHNVLLDMSWGVSLPSLPERTMNVLTVVMLSISLFYLMRRYFAPKMQFPVIIRDYLAILITAAPFLTGFIAYQQWLDYRTVIMCHMLSGQLFLLMLPFSKLGHVIFFSFGRLSLAGELNIKWGNRVWKPDFYLEKLPGDEVDTTVDADYIRYMLDQKRTQMKMMLACCSRCSNCAESCFFYANTRDASYIPSHKVFHTLGKLYRKRGRVSRQELVDMVDILWNKCVLCDRCHCPMGLKIPDMLSLARSICRSQGVYKTYDSPGP
jgi:ferredoxin